MTSDSESHDSSDHDDVSGPRLPSTEIFAFSEYVTQPPLRRDFMPWHKPRKQLVRRDHWGAEIEWLLQARPDGDRSLRYLGLPGSDLLDIRYFYGRFCQHGHCKLTFLGFDNAARPGSSSRDALNVSLQEIRALEHIDQQSDVLGDNFENLANDDSIAWDQSRRLGPFDVVNLDLCAGLARDEPVVDLSMYNAIHQLCGLQARHARPWSLFVTSRFGSDHFSSDVVSALLSRLRDNVEDCPGFGRAFEVQFGELERAPTRVLAWDAKRFFDTMAVGLAKWLLGLAREMRSKLSVSSAAVYRVVSHAPHPDMLSMVVRFEPIPKIGPDPAGLATAVPIFPDECIQAGKLPQAIAERVDIDEKLAGDRMLRAEMRDATAELLRGARYDPTEYRTWADRMYTMRTE
jgi:hypothetical protein